jgi:dolichol-phosphate mannosyltransferase
MQPGLRALVVLPTYNEADNLRAIASRILHEEGFGVLIVDDGSPDGTGRIADALAGEQPGRVEVLHRSGPRGLGLSYVDGFTRALQIGVPLVVQMDADGSHDPMYLPALLKAAAAADLVIGSRYGPGAGIRDWPLRRLLLSTFANRYVQAVARLGVRDCTSGFRCWRSGLLARIPLQQIRSEGYAFQVEMVFNAHAAGARIVEVPIVFVERRAGASKLSRRVMLESAVLPWRLLMRRRRD